MDIHVPYLHAQHTLWPYMCLLHLQTSYGQSHTSRPYILHAQIQHTLWQCGTTSDILWTHGVDAENADAEAVHDAAHGPGCGHTDQSTNPTPSSLGTRWQHAPDTSGQPHQYKYVPNKESRAFFHLPPPL